MNIYQSHAYKRSVGWSTWHLQWCTKYRYKIFGSYRSRNLCKIFLYETARRYGFTILDCEVDKDHVHVVVSIPLTMTPLQALNYLKGCSARGLFIERPDLKILYKRGHLWSPGKFVGSVGHITLEKAKAYIEAHHAKITSTESQLLSEAKESPEGRAFRPGRTSILRRSFF